jgi:NTE family protein
VCAAGTLPLRESEVPVVGSTRSMRRRTGGQMRRGLALGGGGPVGIAWESGLTKGLFEGGVDLRLADLVVGTSAGSVVGTRIAAGHDPRALEQRPHDARPSGSIEPTDLAGTVAPDLETLAQVFSTWLASGEMTPERCAEIGTLARKARTIDEEAFVALISDTHGERSWPARLVVTAVDVESGAFAAHDASGGAPLARAVAASCAVPGIFPTVRIGERRYMDGGLRSGTSADLLLGLAPEQAIVVAPLCKAQGRIGALAERLMWAEVARLRAQGTQVCVVVPESADLAAFGGNLMNGAAAPAAFEAGYERGLALASGEAAAWGGR